MSLIKINNRFQTQQDCIDYLESKRWANGVECPYCKSKKISVHNEKSQSSRKQCQSCYKSFSVLVKTIFESSKLPLIKWFMAINLIVEAKKGISALQVSRNLDITYKTAWFIIHKIRKALKQDHSMLCGIVEMDETYVKTDKDDEDNHKGGTGRGTSNTPVVGMVEKNGNIKAFATNDTTFFTLANLAVGNIKRGSIIHTDEYKAYAKFDQYFPHKTVNHSKEYVSADDITTNSIEGFWSLLKRGIKGQFHHISKKYLQAYVNEFSYRYNQRKEQTEIIFEDVVNRMLVY
jgi:transposase-like protein